MGKSTVNDNDLSAVGDLFDLPGRLVSVQPITTGHINESFIGTCAGTGRQRVLLQRLNRAVFPNIPQLMTSMLLVLEHLSRAAGSRTALGEPLRFYPAKAGGFLVEDHCHDYWRAAAFLENSESFDICPSSGHALAVGRAFGGFIWALRTMAPDRIAEPIPHFQNVAGRLGALEKAAKENSAGRLNQVGDLLEMCRTQASRARLIEEAVRSNEVPLRITHADPKVNNVLFVEGSEQVRALVDLDTVMPGTCLYDFGDMLRSAATSCREDEEDLTKVAVNLKLATALTEGFTEQLGQDLTNSELELLPVAPGVIAFGLGMRFLADYLNGDTYFRVTYTRQNLNRARTQFAISERFIAQEGYLRVLCRPKAGRL